MKKKAILLTLTISLISCGAASSAGKPPSGERVVLSDIERVNLLEREQGYSHLENIVIRSTAELDRYRQSIEPQSGWNDKATFLAELQRQKIDFDRLNLLIYFHAEGSGSIGVALEEPIWEGENAVVHLTRTVPEIGTADMAYYAYAFTIKKTIPKVIFVINDRRIEIQNNDTF